MNDGAPSPTGAPVSGQVVIAPDKFKGSLTASEVASRLRDGIRLVVPDADLRLAPAADGGEGTVEAALASGFEPLAVRVSGPYGAPVDTVVAVRGETAVVELAQASGLQLIGVGERRPLLASSFGTGEMILAALDAGCRIVVLGIGGSANTDGGAGLVQALGVRLLDAAGQDLPGGGAALADLALLETGALDPRIAETTFVVASDVDNPLLGASGAAAVFGPQKGASPAQVILLEAGLARWADVVRSQVGHDHARTPGAGASGGVGFGAMAFLGARLESGIQLMLELTGFADLLSGARLVVTGEGSLDHQSLGGKTPVGVSRAARAAGVRTVAVAGVTSLPEEVLRAAGFDQTYTLQQLEPDLARCIADAGPLVGRIGRRIAEDWLSPSADDAR